MPRESRRDKADRMVREGRVEVTHIVNDDYWTAIVEGNTDTYLVTRTPEGKGCECHYGAERGCSHYLAAEAVAFSLLVEAGAA